MVDGLNDGSLLGSVDGFVDKEGAAEGPWLGLADTVGSSLGTCDGDDEGLLLGSADGLVDKEGAAEGPWLGLADTVGSSLGTCDGEDDGSSLGPNDGLVDSVGSSLGRLDGLVLLLGSMEGTGLATSKAPDSVRHLVHHSVPEKELSMAHQIPKRWGPGTVSRWVHLNEVRRAHRSERPMAHC